MKIAVAGSDTTTLNAHFGFADYFNVFELGTDGPTFVEARWTTPHCSDVGGDHRKLDTSVGLLTDCRAVIAAAIGPCARQELEAHHILPVEYDGPGLEGAQSLLATLRTYLAKRVNPKESAL